MPALGLDPLLRLPVEERKTDVLSLAFYGACTVINKYAVSSAKSSARADSDHLIWLLINR